MNQRRRTRVESRKPVTVTCLQGDSRGEIVNVSLKGCLLELTGDNRPAEGEEVSVVIHLEPGKDGFDISVQGQVVRHYDEGVAVEFTEVPPESFHHLFRLIQYNAPDPEGIEKELGSLAFGSKATREE